MTFRLVFVLASWAFLAGRSVLGHAQLTMYSEAITPTPRPRDPHAGMMPSNCVECTSRAFYFWRSKNWPSDGEVEEDWVDRKTRKVKKWTHVDLSTGGRDGSVTAEQFALWCAHLFAQRRLPLECSPADMNAPEAPAIYDPQAQFRVYAGTRDPPAASSSSPQRSSSGGGGWWPIKLPPGDQSGKRKCYVWIFCW